MSSMFPTFTRKSGWFTLTLPDSLITKFLLTKGGVGSFGFSHLFKASFSVFACFGSPGLVFLAVRGFPFLAPGSRFLVRRNTSRFSDILSDVVFGFSWFRVSSSTRKKVNLSKLEVFRCNSHEGDRKTCLTYFTLGRDLVPQAQHNFPSFAPCTGNSRQSWILDSEPWIPDWGTAFQSLLVEIGF